jgi:Transposase IS200 like
MKKSRQLEFVWSAGHGGARKGAGRKRQGPRARVSHGGKGFFSRKNGARWRVLHVTCRIKEGLPSLRSVETIRLLMALLARVCEREGFRIVEFSIQCNHIHLLCEAEDQASLSSAMNGSYFCATPEQHGQDAQSALGAEGTGFGGQVPYRGHHESYPVPTRPELSFAQR